MIEDVCHATLLSGLPGLRHGFFTRRGGTSKGLYASLNCGLGSADERRDVLANRDRVARYLGAGDGSVVTVHQVHGSVALAVSSPFDGAPPKADALVTGTPGVVVAALAADCAPVLFADPDAKIVAAAHAGWRGALSGILEATVSEMERLGARRASIIAAIGPCIHQANYEVGLQFKSEFVNAATAYERFFLRSRRPDERSFRPAELRCSTARSNRDRIDRAISAVHICRSGPILQLQAVHTSEGSRLRPPNLCHCRGLSAQLTTICAAFPSRVRSER